MVDDYTKSLKTTRSFFPNCVRYLVADGYYYRFKFWKTVPELNLGFSGKLRVDADLRYLYTGEQKKLGAPRKYDGKVGCNDLSRLNLVKEIKPGVSRYTLVEGELLFKLPNLRKLVSRRFKPTEKSKMLYYLALIFT